MSLDRRKDKRIHNELYVKLQSPLLIAWGLLCDVSENGLFIKSNCDFTMGKPIDIELFMPDNNNSLLKGVIRRKIALPDSHRKYGLGIELIEKDIVYRYFLKSLKGQTKTPLQTPSEIGNKQEMF
jgi:hypothetical protein